MLLLAAFLMCAYPKQGRNGVIQSTGETARQISPSLPFLFIPITTKNKTTHDGSDTTLCPGGCAVNLLVPLSWECWEIKEEKWKEW